MEYMMVCTTKSEGKGSIEQIFQNKEDLGHLTWLIGTNAEKKEIRKIPFIGTSFQSIYEHEEQMVGLAMIPSIQKVKKIFNKLKSLKNNGQLLDLCVLPIISQLEDLE